MAEIVSDKLLECVKSVAEREQCMLYDLEIVGGGRNRVVRVFIDKAGEEGVSIDDCARVSRALDLIFDVEDLIPGGTYNLEVSSPGLDRKLRLPWHYQQAFGKKVNLQLVEPLGTIDPQTPDRDSKRKKLVGLVGEVSDGAVKIFLQAGGESTLSIPLAKIKKAQVVYEFEDNKNKKM